MVIHMTQHTVRDHGPAPGPTAQTPPPTGHPSQKPNPNQKPNPETRTPTILPTLHHPHPTRYPAHMPWTTSNRRQRLPTNWNKLRNKVLAKANYKCAGLDPDTTPPPSSREAVEGCHRWHHPACDMRATDVDHIDAGDNHEISNLQALSHACHTAKTAHENAAAKARIRAAATRERPPHPCARATQTKKHKSINKRKQNPKRNDATRNLELKKFDAEKNEAAPWHRLPSPHTRKTGGDSNHGAGCSLRQRLG